MTTNTDSSVSIPEAPDSTPIRRSVGRPRKNPEGVPASEMKTSVYLPGNTLESVRATAARLDQSVSWVLTRAYKMAQAELDGMSDNG